jgi:Fur family zinc uptake transcriptional regulator
MHKAFPDPGHDHDQCVEEALTRAEKACGGRGLRLTPLRRRVLEILAQSHAPVGAYEIVEKLAASGDPAPAMSVYRALDFLTAENLAHRIESRNAFLACTAGHERAEPVMFLLCEKCGAVAEMQAASFGRDVAKATKAAGFEARSSIIEVSGTCDACRKKSKR